MVERSGHDPAYGAQLPSASTAPDDTAQRSADDDGVPARARGRGGGME